MVPFAANLIGHIILREYHMLVLVQVRYVWLLVLAYHVRELARESHVVHIYEVFILLNEKFTELAHGKLDTFWLALLQHFQNLLLP